MALDPRSVKAIQKALEVDGAAKVERVEYGTYLVPSASSGETYVVTATDGEYACTCIAGQHGRACWHKAAVLIAKVEHASRARVIGPAPVPSPQPATVKQAPRRQALV